MRAFSCGLASPAPEFPPGISSRDSAGVSLTWVAGAAFVPHASQLSTRAQGRTRGPGLAGGGLRTGAADSPAMAASRAAAMRNFMTKSSRSCGSSGAARSSAATSSLRVVRAPALFARLTSRSRRALRGVGSARPIRASGADGRGLSGSTTAPETLLVGAGDYLLCEWRRCRTIRPSTSEPYVQQIYICCIFWRADGGCTARRRKREPLSALARSVASHPCSS